MTQKCINSYCRTKHSEKFLPVYYSVSNYYHVPYKPYQQVCGACLRKCIKHFYRLGKQMKSQECIFNNEFPARPELIELSDDEETADNIPTSTSSKNTHETELSEYIKTVWFKDIKHPVDVQLQKCKEYLNTEKHKITETNNQINNLVKQINIDIGKLYSNVYKFDRCRQFHYEEEVNIIDENTEKIDRDNDVIQVVKNKLIKPPVSKLRRHSLKSGDQVYAQKSSLLQPWFEATVLSEISITCFNILFNDGEKKNVNTKNLAYINTSNTQYPIGSRVIAKFKDVNIKMTDNFFAGSIAELPKYFNKFRFVLKSFKTFFI